MRSLALLALTLVGLGLGAACGDTTINNLPTTPTPYPPPIAPVVQTSVEFRAMGTPSTVRLRYSTPAEGLAQVVTALPYGSRFTMATTDPIFLSLEGTPIPVGFLVNPFFTIQIVVNGVMFREATTIDQTITLLISGTWRRQL